MVVHESRILRFDGVKLPDRLTLQNNGWGDSILNRLYDGIRAYATVHGTVPGILQDFVQAIYKIAGLKEMLAQGNDKAVMDRLQIVNLTRSIYRAVVLDENETWDRQTTTTTGLPDLIDRTERRLVAESGFPHTKLLGESPGASLGEGGGSEAKDWYDLIAAMQEERHREPLTYLLTLIMSATKGPTGGKVPTGWSFTFRSLWQLDEKEQAQIRKLQAETDMAYIGSGVLSAGEVAASRFGGDAYSTETALDQTTRDALAKASDMEFEDGSEDDDPRAQGHEGADAEAG
jgi:phage-related protein (TIGR01555 family)